MDPIEFGPAWLVPFSSGTGWKNGVETHRASISFLQWITDYLSVELILKLD